MKYTFSLVVHRLSSIWLIISSLLWRHNGGECVSNHQPHDCLINHLFRRRSKETSKIRWPVNSPHKGPVTRKIFQFDDVIMCFFVFVVSSALNGFAWFITHIFHGHYIWHKKPIQDFIKSLVSDAHNALIKALIYMMTSSNGNIFRVTGPLSGKFIGHRWFPLTKASDAELWFYYLGLNNRLSKQFTRRWFDTPSCSLWHHYNLTHISIVWLRIIYIAPPSYPHNGNSNIGKTAS